LILALADDLTGALEIGAKFAEHDLPAIVVTEFDSLKNPECPVLVIDTETRHLTPDQAAARTRHVAGAALPFSPWLIYKKTDSTLRGNIAAELRAVQDVFGSRRMVYAPAYPDMGRTVKSGELFVWGTPVHETVFAKDLWNPVAEGKIEQILDDVPAVILDGESNEDIQAAVYAIFAEPAPHLCAGPAALAGALANHLKPGLPVHFQTPSASRCLVVNGSLHPVSIGQMQFAEENGLFNEKWIRLDEQIECTGMERAMRTGECVRRRLASSNFGALLVFGGDTAFGIHRSLGSAPFKPRGEIAPGVPVSESGGLLWITKAGGFGARNLLSTIRDRLI
jgi:D-threonate/D-erythronate kinase